MYKGVVFFDYDGTMVDESDKISKPTQKTLESFQKLKSNGYMVAICSGRPFCQLPKIDFKFDCYINSNGACARINDKIVFNSPFDFEDTLKIFEFCKKHNITYYCETTNLCYVGDIHPERIYEPIKLFNVPEESFVSLDYNNLNEIKDTNKMVFIFEKDKEKMEETTKLFYKEFGEKLTTFRQLHEYSLDIAKKHFSKAVGIKAVVEYCGFDIKDTYAFGDGANDKEMIECVGNGIVMGKYDHILEGVGDYYTDTVKNEGITKGLIHYNLI